MKILLIDERSDDLRRIREILIEGGGDACTIDTASELGAAFSQLRRRDYDVVLLDVSPPGGLPRLRALLRGAPAFPVVGMTRAKVSPLDTRWLEEGADDLVEKATVTGRSLIRILAHATARRAAAPR